MMEEERRGEGGEEDIGERRKEDERRGVWRREEEGGGGENERRDRVLETAVETHHPGPLAPVRNPTSRSPPPLPLPLQDRKQTHCLSEALQHRKERQCIW